MKRSRSRSGLGRFEAMERRTLLSGLAFSFRVDDPGGAFASYPLMMTDLNEAGAMLGSVLNGRGTIDVVVRPESRPGMAGAGAPVAWTQVGTLDGVAVDQPGPLTEALTGSDPNGSGDDVVLTFSPTFLASASFDPGSSPRPLAAPAGTYDFVSRALGELVNGLGVASFRGNAPGSYGTIGGTESSFDALTSFGAGGDPTVLAFTGPQAEAIYGGPVPLTSAGTGDPALSPQNFAHTGNPPGRPGADLGADLLYGGGARTGAVQALSLLDQAMLADLGWSLDPTIGFLSDSAVDECAGTLTSVVARTGDVSQSASVHYSTVDGSARAGVNYAATTGTLTFAPGQARAAVAVPILADHAVTGDLQFSLALDSPTGGVVAGTQGTQGIRVADRTTILGLDASPTTHVGEDDGSASIVVTRDSADLSSTVSVHYATTPGSAVDGVNYRGESGTITFGPGEVAKTIAVPVLQDHLHAGDLDFLLALDSPSGPGDVTTSTTTTDVVIDDTTDRVDVDASSYATTEDSGEVDVVVDRSGRMGSLTLTVHYATSGGSAALGTNYAGASGTLTFAPGQSQATIPIYVFQDGAITGDRDFYLTLSQPGAGAVIGRSSAHVTIADTTNLLSIAGPTVAVTESDGEAHVLVTRSGPGDSTTASLTFATADGTAKAGSNYVATTGTVTFAPGQYQATIDVPVLQDGLAVDGLGFAVNVIALGAGDYLSGAASTSVTIANTTGTVAFSDPDATVDETAGTVTFRVVKDGAGAASVAYRTSDGSAQAGVNYAATAGVLHFAAGHDVQAITVPILDDSAAGPPVSFRLDLGATTGDVAVSPASGSRAITVTNVDVPGVTLAIPSGTASVVEQGAPCTVLVSLKTRPSAPVTITPSSGDARLSFPGGPIKFTPANWDVPQGLPIAASFDGQRASGSPSTVDFAVGGSDSSYGGSLSRSLALAVGNPPGLAPTWTRPADVTIDEGGASTVALSASSPFIGGSVAYALGAGTPAWITLSGNQVTIRPPSGPADVAVSVSATDDGASPSSSIATFAVHVNDVAPAIQAGADASLPAGTAFARTVFVSDPGVGPLTATVDYGDGSGPATLPLDASRTAKLDHAFASAGTYPVVILVRDSGGASGTARFSVTATATPAPATLALAGASFSADETASAATITVSRGGDLSGTATVNYATSPADATAGVDYQETSGVLTFGPGVASASFPVSVLHDAASFSDRTVNLTLSSPSGATLGATSRSLLTIRNVDTPPAGTPAPGGPVGGGPAAPPMVGPPTVQVIAKKGKVSRIVLTFSADLDASSASDSDHFALSTVVKGKKAGKAIRVASVSYDASHHAVTLTPRGVLKPSGFVSLRVDGVRDALGRALDGDRNGSAGGAYATTLNLKTGRASD